jgi:hypothetical protein
MLDKYLNRKETDYIKRKKIDFRLKQVEWNFRSRLKKKIVKESHEFYKDALEELVLAHGYLESVEPESIPKLGTELKSQNNALIQFLRTWFDQDEIRRVFVNSLVSETTDTSNSRIEFHEPQKIVSVLSEYLEKVKFDDSILEMNKKQMIESLESFDKELKGRIFIPISRPGMLMKYASNLEKDQKERLEMVYSKLSKMDPDDFPKDGYSSSWTLEEVTGKWRKWFDWARQVDDKDFTFIRNRNQKVWMPSYIMLMIGNGNESVDSEFILACLVRAGLVDENRFLPILDRKVKAILFRMQRRGMLKKVGSKYVATEEGERFGRFISDLNYFD